MTQPTLFSAPGVPPPPRAVVEFLAGFTARFAYGENPTAAQKRAAALAAEKYGRRLAELRAAP